MRSALRHISRARPRAGTRVVAGFTLLEVVIALAILSVSLVMLLTTNASSIDNASRSRDITIATLLARSKMIDLELLLADEGFTEGDQEENGDFNEEGYPEIKWKAEIKEIDITMENLTRLCEGFMDEGDDVGEEGSSCDSMLGGFGLPLEGLTAELSNSVRLVKLELQWPVGTRYHEKLAVSALLTREDLALDGGGLMPGNMPQIPTPDSVRRSDRDR